VGREACREARGVSFAHGDPRLCSMSEPSRSARCAGPIRFEPARPDGGGTLRSAARVWEGSFSASRSLANSAYSASSRRRSACRPTQPACAACVRRGGMGCARRPTQGDLATGPERVAQSARPARFRDASPCRYADGTRTAAGSRRGVEAGLGFGLCRGAQHALQGGSEAHVPAPRHVAAAHVCLNVQIEVLIRRFRPKTARARLCVCGERA
jgi:hypothetical protein